MHMPEVTIAYGMTETSPVSTQSARDDDLERRVSPLGRVHPHVEIRIVDPAMGTTLPRGAAWEFCTRGYSVMRGYWDEEVRTREAIDAEGWMHTGDVARMDEAGYVNIVGRLKDVVIGGGENIYPREVEEFLYTHDAVQEVQVFGVPDPKYGEELCAWVRLRPGTSANEEAIRGVLPRSHRALQNPALRTLRGELPDDRHWQDAEVQDARGHGRRARSHRDRFRLRSRVQVWMPLRISLVFRAVPRITYDDPHTAGHVGGAEILPHC
jgi:fatty-acyl-CoA synthase